MSELRNKIKNIPIIGHALWWLYMIVKGPEKIVNLYSEVSRLSAKTAAIESAVKKSACNNQTEHGWADFYNHEVTDVFMAENVEHHKHFIDVVLKYTTKNSHDHLPRLMEIGIGTATMSIYLSKTQSFDVIGLDSDPLVIAKAVETNVKLGGHAKFIRMDACDMPDFFREKSFNVAFSQGTMEHFNNDDLQRILIAQSYAAEFVIFSVPSIYYPNQDYGNERRLSKEDWATLLKNFGLKTELVEYYQNDLHVLCVVQGE